MTTLGFRAHTAWAAVVALDGEPQEPTVIDRRRLDFVAERMPTQPYHAAAGLEPDAAEALVQKASESATDVAAEAIGRLRDELGGVRSAGVVLGTGRAPTSVARALASHAGKHAAEGEFARQVLIDACTSLRLDVVGVRERELHERGASVLGLDPNELTTRIVELGKRVGSPWAKDQKDAALVAWIALASGR